MIRSCPMCSVRYEADPKRLKHGRQTTCSRKCSYRRRASILTEQAKERFVPKLCFCGSEILTQAKYCSEECRVKYRDPHASKGIHRVPHREYKCFYCEKVFKTWNIRRKNRTFCDRKCYEQQKSQDMSGSKNPMYGKAPHFKPSMWKQGWHLVGQQRCYFRSSWELVVAHYLENQNLVWKYEYRRYKLASLDKTYVPDFFILDNDTIEKIIEVKGWMKQKDRDKIASFRSEYKIPLEVWERKKLRSLNLLDCNGYGAYDGNNE